MHRITKMDLDNQCNEYVDDKVKEVLSDYISKYNNCDYDNEKDDLFQRIVSNTPMGLELKARVTTNYLQLKSIYNQRKHHKLNEWDYFCNKVYELPCFKEFVLGEEQ